MAMIKGMTIVLKTKVQTGVDGFDRPTYQYIDELVENVLVYPGASSDILSTIDLTGNKTIYTLAIPKGDTHNWKNQIVEFFGRKWKTVGVPLEGIEENIPLEWNKKVTVECYE